MEFVPGRTAIRPGIFLSITDDYCIPFYIHSYICCCFENGKYMGDVAVFSENS